jgi:hypothetical protein
MKMIANLQGQEVSEQREGKMKRKKRKKDTMKNPRRRIFL